MLVVLPSLVLVSLMTVVNMLPTAVMEGVVLLASAGWLMVLLPESLLVLGGCRLEAVTVLAMLAVVSVLAVESETLNTVDAATLDDGSVLCDTG